MDSAVSTSLADYDEYSICRNNKTTISLVNIVLNVRFLFYSLFPNYFTDVILRVSIPQYTYEL